MADYNINAVTRKVSYTGSAGVGPYAFSFEILVEDDVAVYFNTTLLTLTTDYSVTINANGTGSVTIVVGTNVPTTPDADDTIIIVGARDIERTTDFVTAGDLRAAALNEQLDSGIIFDQQISERVDRALTAPIYDPTGIDMTLPAKADRAGTVLGFNASTGDPEAGPTIADVSTLAAITADIATLADIEDGTDATDAIQTVAANNSNVTTVAGISGNVTTVAGISSDVTAVAADATDIGTVSTNIANVNTVAGISSNVTTVASNNANVTTVADNVSDVNTVAGISGNVSTVAGISSDVTTVAADGTDIGTVATNIANVNTVAGISGNVTTVAGISANVTTVAGDQADIGTVATNISNVNTVAGINSDVTTVAGISANVTSVAADATDIGTVATNMASVNTVAGNSANVTTVAGISSDVTAVANISGDIQDVQDQLTAVQTVADDLQEAVSEIETVGANIANVNTVAGISSDVTTAAGNSANITTVAGISGNVTTVAGISANVTAVAGDAADIGTVATDLAGSDNIGTVAGSISNVNAVGGAIADVSTVATNLSDVQSFANTYRIGATDPTVSLDEGDLFFNTTDNALKYYDGTSWASITAGLTDIVGDVTPQLGGNLDTNGNDITFGDNDKAIFGAGSDLQIYHDGNRSWIDDAGTGDLRLRTNGAEISLLGSGNTYMVQAVNAGAVSLYNNNSKKLATTSTGIDVTGTVTADGLTVDGDINAITDAVVDVYMMENDTTDLNTLLRSNAGDFSIRTSNDAKNVLKQRLNIDHATGDISFYEDTGTTAKLFWDASAESLGIGTSSPSANLEVSDSANDANLKVTATAANRAALLDLTGTIAGYNWISSDTNGTADWRIGGGAASGTLTFATGSSNAEAMRITSGGNVGIGTTSPGNTLEVFNSGDTQIRVQNGSSAQSYDFGRNGSSGLLTFYGNQTGFTGYVFSGVDGERMRILPNGNFLVGKSASSVTTEGLEWNQSGTHKYLFLQNDTTSSVASVLYVHRNGSDGRAIEFRRSNSTEGNISVTTTGTTYNTTSDARLKTDIQPIADATDRLMQMNPVSHKWKADPEADAVVGFIAQEMQEIVPEAVSGDADSDEMMSMDYGRITPVLVAALQEATKEIQELKARVAELEAK